MQPSTKLCTLLENHLDIEASKYLTHVKRSIMRYDPQGTKHGTLKRFAQPYPRFTITGFLSTHSYSICACHRERLFNLEVQVNRFRMRLPSKRPLFGHDTFTLISYLATSSVENWGFFDYHLFADATDFNFALGVDAHLEMYSQGRTNATVIVPASCAHCENE